MLKKEASQERGLEVATQTNQVHTFREKVIDLVRILFSKQNSIQGKYGTHADLLGMFFIQERLNQRGEKFYVLKLRTMQTNAHAEFNSVITNGAIDAHGHAAKDHRVTRIGKLLRASKIDEIPQLIQCLAGKATGENPMDFIGAIRPMVPECWERLGLREYNKKRLTSHVSLIPIDITVKPDDPMRSRFKAWAKYLQIVKRHGKEEADRRCTPRMVAGILRHVTHETLHAIRSIFTKKV